MYSYGTLSETVPLENFWVFVKQYVDSRLPLLASLWKTDFNSRMPYWLKKGCCYLYITLNLECDLLWNAAIRGVLFFGWTIVLPISYFNQIFKQITVAAKIEMADQFCLMGAVKIILLSDPPKLVYSDSGSVKSTAINKSTIVWK